MGRLPVTLHESWLWSAASACSVAQFQIFSLTFSTRVKVALRSENVRAWHEVEHDFLECEYRSVRDRQMKELELEDDLLSKIPVRSVMVDGEVIVFLTDFLGI